MTEKFEPKTEFIITKIDIVEDNIKCGGNHTNIQSSGSCSSSFSPSSDNTTTSSDSNLDELKMTRVNLIKQRLGIELEKKVFNNMRNLRV